ncbi:MAG: energy-coupling factor ABC transporter permease [Paraprevotella sp.]|nr:energy-coupling factor ABC transporter permease [Paraprevotella sp.]
MHIESALISTTVATGFAVVQSGAAGTVARKLFKEEKSPVSRWEMALAGTFVFALQMLNFSIPGTGSSGHIVGAVLLCHLLGQRRAFLVMGGILTVQSLFFGDGGLLALGCNWFNMGFLPCLVVYPLLKKYLKSASWQAFLGPVAGVLLGALSASLQIGVSGYATLSFPALMANMLFIHLLIGIGEGAATWGLLQLLQRQDALMRIRILLSAAFMAGGVLSLFASENPDGLEWSLYRQVGTLTSPLPTDVPHLFFERIQHSLR